MLSAFRYFQLVFLLPAPVYKFPDMCTTRPRDRCLALGAPLRCPVPDQRLLLAAAGSVEAAGGSRRPVYLARHSSGSPGWDDAARDLMHVYVFLQEATRSHEGAGSH